jgi:hypothetical protein
MKFKVVLIGVLAGLLASFVWLGATSAQRRASNSQPEPASSSARMVQAYGKLPLAFEANRGQSGARVKFLARGDGYALFLTGHEAVLKLRGRQGASQSPASDDAGVAIVKMKLAGADASPAVEGIDRLPGKNNYFVGSDPRGWHTGVESFAAVRYKAVYPGIDLIWHGNQRQLEYDFRVAPGARAERIRLAFDGAQAVTLNEDGSLMLRAGKAEARMLQPVAWQEVDGRRQMVACRYRLDGTRVAFELGAYEAGKPLVIDPVLVYSTFVGGAGFDEAYSIAVDGEGSAYLAGITESADFPGPSPVQQAKGTQTEAFILKLNPAGNAVVYATWLGGSGVDVANRIIVDAAGGAVVAGNTSSPNFPLKDALQTARGGAADAFIARLNPAGSALVYSTLLGGSGNEAGNGIALDASGNLYVMGNTNSLDFPLMNPLHRGAPSMPASTRQAVGMGQAPD